jgi:hypothetical protein
MLTGDKFVSPPAGKLDQPGTLSDAAAIRQRERGGLIEQAERFIAAGPAREAIAACA